MKTLAERFWAKVGKAGRSECWEWTACRDHRGYGAIGAEGNGGKQHLRAHRVSWELHFGPIPDGMFVCHHCDNRGCVNPTHLFLGTAADNTADMLKKGRGSEPPGTKENREKTQCPAGHLYDSANTRHDTRGSRYCLTCKREKKRAFDDASKRRRSSA